MSKEPQDDLDDTRRALLLALPGLTGLALAGAAEAQDAVKAQPSSYKVVLENSHMRVLEYNSRPGMGVCGDGVHSHPAHLTVLLTPAKVHIKENGHDMMVSQNTGDVFWSEAVTHETENLSGGDIRSLLIELKKA